MRSILLPIRIVLVGLAASPFAPGQVTTRVSLTWNQEQVSAIVDFRSALSADGRFVALSANSSLAPINTFANKEVFVRDRQTGTVDLVSRATSGALSNGFSNLGDMSADGRFVVFESAASTLVAGDTNGTHDIFLRDRQLGATVCVSVNSLGAPANDSSARPTVSADGRFVCFQSYATDLVAGDTNAAPDVFVRDMLLGSTERVSLSSVGAQVALGGENPHISGDGRCVLFTSLDANVVPGDLNTLRDSFVRDRQAGTTTLVSLGSAGGPAHSDCYGEAISGDGRFVTFSSWDGTLVPGDTNHDYDVFVRDTLAGTTECASVDSAGNLGDGRSSQSALSADGRYVAFESIATNLVPGSPALSSGVFVHDRLTGATLLASIDSGGNPAEDFSISQQPAISGDGSTVAFLSDATNLVEGDTNHAPDLFVRGSAPPPVVFPRARCFPRRAIPHSRPTPWCCNPPVSRRASSRSSCRAIGSATRCRSATDDAVSAGI